MSQLRTSMCPENVVRLLFSSNVLGYTCASLSLCVGHGWASGGFH